ncbi:MAG: hypothetical protein DI537_05425 [Stutzerimonas stutzeri]|nr:MAG: hypothetical protein DI537_05425 [Stutzerimonas stutzeri]
MARKPFGRADKHPHQNSHPAKNERSGSRRGERASDLADAAMEIGGAGVGGGLLSRLPMMQMLKTALLAYVSYRGGTSLATFWNELKNGTPFDLREKSEKASTEAARKAASVPGTLERNLATVAGKDGLSSGQSVTESLGGRGATDLALHKDAHAAIVSDASASTGAPNLAAQMKGQVLRLALPGRGDRVVDFPLTGAVNDESALAELQSGYAEFAKKRGLPGEIPLGTSVTVGVPSAGIFSSEDKSAREYRYLGGRSFEQNTLMRGSLETPGDGSWRTDPAFKSASYRFDVSAVGQSSSDIVKAATLSEQSADSSLFVQRQRLEGMLEPAVTTPVSVGNRLLGHSAGSDFQNLLGGLGLASAEAVLTRSHDAGSGASAVGVEGPAGAVSVQSGAVDRVAAARHREETSIFVSLEAEKGSIGKFSPKGEFVGTEAASRAFETVGLAAKSAENSPVLAAANDVGVPGRKAVYASLQAGQEGLTTRVAYEGRVVDYHARNGSMVIVERDPATHEPKEASIIRSQGIKLKDGKLELDAKTSGLVREHVELSAQGRSEEFGTRHPAVREQFASIAEQGAKVEQATLSSKGGELSRSEATAAMPPLDNGGASKSGALKAAGLEELNSTVASSFGVASQKTRAAGMEIGG